MKIEEITLFNVHEPVSDELIKQWKVITSKIVNNTQIIVDEDNFLRENIDELRIEWKYDPRNKNIFYGHVHRQEGKIHKDLGINISALERAVLERMNFVGDLIFQLYKIPGEEKNVDRLPVVQKQLKKWVDVLGNDFFTLYPSYHSQLKAAGIHLGLMKNYRERVRQNIFDLCLALLKTGVQGKGVLYDLGDVVIERLERGKPQRRSLLELGSYRMIIGYRDDHLAHYVVGTPVSTTASVFPLTDSEVGTEMGKELRRKIDEVYKGANPLVKEKLSEHAKLIGQDTFDECYHPSLTEEGNYLSLVEAYLADCIEMKKLMSQQQTTSSIKPNSDEKYKFDKFNLSNAIRKVDYVE